MDALKRVQKRGTVQPRRPNEPRDNTLETFMLCKLVYGLYQWLELNLKF